MGQGAGAGLGVADRLAVQFGDPHGLARVGQRTTERLGRIAAVEEGLQVPGRVHVAEGFSEGLGAQSRQHGGVFGGGFPDAGVGHDRRLDRSGQGRQGASR